MSEQGYASEAIANTIDQAIATDQLDDAAFAKLWVRDRMWHHPLSRAAISQELRQKGVDAELISATLQAEYPAEQETELATHLARERMNRYMGISVEKRRNRLVAFLARRGFSRGLVYQVVKAVEKEFDRGDD